MSDDTKVELTNVQQIVQHSMNKEPSMIKNLVSKEIASRVMDRIEARKTDIGSSVFGK